MTDYSQKIAKAKASGYSDAEIATYLSSDSAFAPKIKQAKDAGYSDAEIIGHLSGASSQQPQAPTATGGAGTVIQQPLADIPGSKVQDAQGNILTAGLKQNYEDFMTPVRQASSQLGEDAKRVIGGRFDKLKQGDFSGTAAPGQMQQSADMQDALTLGGDAASYVMAPINGAVHAMVAPFTRKANNAIVDSGRVVPTVALKPQQGSILPRVDVNTNIDRQRSFENLDNAVGTIGGIASMALGNESGGGILTRAAKQPKVAGPIARLANKATGGRLLDANEQARAILIRDIQKDGGTPAQIQNILTEWQRTGASSPSLMDAVTRLPSGGQATLARIRGSAMNETAARNVVKPYRNELEAGLQDRAQNLTQGLVDDPRSTQQFIDDTETVRGNNARQNYAPLYQERVPVDESVRSAVADDVGRGAVNAAIDSAVANRDYAVAEDLRGLLTENPTDISAGALEEVRQALRDRGAAMSSNPGAPVYNRRAGAGLQGRSADINTTLDQVPAIQPARADYGNQSGAIEAADLGNSVLSALPDNFQGAFTNIQGRMRPVDQQPAALAQGRAQGALALGSRNRLVDEIGRPAQGATGVLNRISSAPNTTRNLEVAFGDAAAPYQAGIGNEVTRVQNARAIDPNFGSQTAARGSDAGADSLGLVEGATNLATGGKSGLLKAAIQALKGGLTLTPAERQAIVELGLSQADIRVLANAPETIYVTPSGRLASSVKKGVLANTAANSQSVQLPALTPYAAKAAAEDRDKKQRRTQ